MAFVPHPLPPEPPLQLSGVDQDLLERANRAIGRLDGLSVLPPDTSLFIYFYVRKEAVLSSQIEGKQSSLSDLLLYESDHATPVPLDDVEEVSNYVAAMSLGVKLIREGFPLSLRLLREIHGVLLSRGRGAEKNPGELRSTQNWIGGSRPSNAIFVPPPPTHVPDCMSALEKFMNDVPVRTPTLIKAALAHVQFETIHPFLDGNGRLGRLLVTLLLCAERALVEPVLYLSLFFKKNRQSYYDLLQRVRTEGDWESWLRFFLEGVLQTSDQAVDAARRTVQMFEQHRRTLERYKRSAASALRLQEAMQRKPVLSIGGAAQLTGLTVPTVTAALEKMGNEGLVEEVTGRRRDRVFVYTPYVRLLSEGAD